MKIKILFTLIGALLFCLGCVTGPLDQHTEEIVYEHGKLQRFSYMDKSYGKKEDSSPFLEAIDIIKQVDPMALPELEDLPLPKAEKRKKIRAYTGIIKNTTKYDISVPSANSSATLTVPAHGWIEYTVWQRHFNLTSYVNGKPFHCHKINVSPKGYPFMCKSYDFMAVIAKEEPLPGIKLKKRIRKKPVRFEIEELGKRKGGEITG